MRTGFFLALFLFSSQLWSQSSSTSTLAVAQTDWLIEGPEFASIILQNEKKELILSNGLISRCIRLSPNAATVSLRNLVTGEEYIRSVKPEAVISIDGRSYPVGGLQGQKDHGYLKSEWLDEMQILENSFQFRDTEVREITTRVAWKKNRWPHFHDAKG